MKVFAAVVTAAVLLVAGVGSAARAMEPGDVERLAKAGAGDEVIVAQIRATGARFTLSADEIVRLKKEGVSDAVLKAMIETGAAPKSPAGEVGPEAASEPAGTETGTLVIENLDTRDYSLQIDAGRGNVFVWRGVSSEGRELLPARSSAVYRVSAGSYALRWVGGAESFAVNVAGGRESRATLTRTAEEASESLDVSVVEDGQRRGGGRLVTLAVRAAPAPAEAAPAPAPAPVVVERHYYQAPPQEVRVVQPRTVYYYTEPVVGYARGCRNDTLWLPGLAYGWSRGRSRYAVGWGPGGGLGFSYHRKLGRSGYTFSLGW